MMTLPNKCPIFQEDLKEKAVFQKKGGLFVNWLPIVDEFRNFLMSEDANIIGYQMKDFSVLVEE